LTSDGQNLTKEGLTKGKPQIVDFENKEGAFQIEIKNLFMPISSKMGSLLKK